ncbi:hypothetical protein [Deinococcus sp.]|uniref:hypothetical protein n=1 Tax=Deinococcus sp. TaxID=47478 RepID=UPI0025DE96A9|nr:hypothetical protein [Deinococcus sp.]
MIRFQKTDALHPEKQTTLILDVLPLLAFATGFVIVRSILGNLAAPPSRPTPPQLELR